MAFKNKKGDGWYADWRLPGGRRKRKLMANKRLADQYEAQQKLRIMKGEVGVKEVDEIKLKDFYNIYFERHTKVEKSVRTVKNEPAMMKYILDSMGNLSLSKITPSIINTFVKERLKSVSGTTLNRQLGILSNIFSKAIDWDYYNGTNPVSKFKKFRETNKRVRYLSKEEYALLLENADDRLKDVIILALNTGMRRGEIRNLKRRDLFFQNEVIQITEQKNGEIDHIPMNKSCQEVLNKYRDLDDDARPFGYDCSSTFDRLVRRLKIEGFRFHDLRHTFASYLVMNGVDLNTVRDLMRHKSIKMTLRYAHLSPAFKQSATQRLDRVWNSEKSFEGISEQFQPIAI